MVDRMTPGRPPGEHPEAPDAYTQDPAAPPSGAARNQSGASPKQGEDMQHVKDRARGEAERLKNTATDRARDEAERRKHGVASDLDEVSSALDRSREELDGAGWAGKMLGEAAQQLHRAAQTLDRKSPDELMQDLRRFARSNPTGYLAGCAALGFAAARIARANPDEAHRQEGASYGRA